MILFLMLKEGRCDVFDVIYPTFFFYVLKSSPNGFHCFLIVFYHLYFLFVSYYQMPQSVSHKGQVIGAFIFGLSFVSLFDEWVAREADSQCIPGIADLLPKPLGFFLVLGLHRQYSLLIVVNGFSSLGRICLLLRNKLRIVR